MFQHQYHNSLLWLWLLLYMLFLSESGYCFDINDNSHCGDESQFSNYCISTMGILILVIHHFCIAKNPWILYINNFPLKIWQTGVTLLSLVLPDLYPWMQIPPILINTLALGCIAWTYIPRETNGHNIMDITSTTFTWWKLSGHQVRYHWSLVYKWPKW